MIELINVNKSFRQDGVRTIIARRLSATFPSGKTVAVMGRNGSGKSSLLKMIAGSMDPDRGQIIREGSISWPVGFAGNFHKEMTGAANVRFIARIYGLDTDELLDFVEDFARIGHHINMPVKTYSSGMRSRLSFGVSMGVPFDTYLVDEVSSVGDVAFKEKAAAVLNDRLTTRGAIVVTHSRRLVQRICDAVAILEDGRIDWYDDVEEGVVAYGALATGDPQISNTVDRNRRAS
jgi:capsular polysaccharide transport system ATP-binding protein